MVNKNLFASTRGPLVPATDTTNQAGGRAYGFGPEHALAQLAATGTFNQTFYGAATDQLDGVREAADRCSTEFVAKTAIWARQRGRMKDMPAALCAMLAKGDLPLLERVFERVIDDGKMLRSFVQLVRSGQFGRKSLGSGPKRLVRRWLAGRTDEALFAASVGNDPSLADVIKMVHPQPATPSRRALYGWLLGRDHDPAALPEVVRRYEAFKRGETALVPEVDFRLLTALELGAAQWAEIARRGGWTQTRMSLATYQRHGVFDVPGMMEEIAAKLADPEQVRKARAFPYQLFVTFTSIGAEVPGPIKDALEAAMEVAVENVPAFETQVHVVVDVSGSMGSAVTGARKGATTKARCVDVAALIAAAILRRNPGSTVTPVDTQVHAHDCDPRDSIMTNARKLSRYGGGGTALSAALAHLNAKKRKGGLIVIVSDNESWVDSRGQRGTAVMHELRAYQARNPGARLVCIDLQPNVTTQAPDAPASVLNVGGFSDAVFEQVGLFMQGDISPEHWVGEIAKVAL